MTGLAGPGPLAELAGWAYGFVVLFARVGTLCMLLPGIGEAELPMMLRLGFALALDAVLLPVVAPGLPPAPAGARRFALHAGRTGADIRRRFIIGP